MTEPPIRWLEGGEGAEENLLSVLRQDEALLPPSDAKQRAWAAISARVAAGSIAAPAAVSGSSTGASAAVAGSAVVKGIVLLSTAALVVGVTHWVRQPKPTPTRDNSIATVTVPREATTSSVPPRTEPSAALPAPEVVDDVKPLQVDSKVPKRSASVPAVIASNAVKAALVAVTVEPTAAPTESPPVSKEAATSRLAEESALLRQARQALRQGAPDAALGILADSQSKFPNGELTEEREALAIEAWWSKGARDTARSQAESFFARHPTSPYADRLRELLR